MTPNAALRYALHVTTACRPVPAKTIEAAAALQVVRNGTDEPMALVRKPLTQPQIIHPHAKRPVVVRVPSHCSLNQWMAVAPAMERAGFHTAHNDQGADHLEEFDPDDEAVQHALANPEMYPAGYVRMLQNLTHQKAAQVAA